MRSLSFAVLAHTLSACPATEDYPIGGAYAAVFVDGGPLGTTTSTITLPDIATGETFSFSASYETVLDGAVVDDGTTTGTGTYDYPDLTLTAEGETLTGTVSADGETIRVVIEADEPPATYRRAD